MPQPFLLQCGARRLELSQPRVMGILNLTPDSFSDGGRFVRRGRIDVVAVEAAAMDMVAAGAAIIDLGGESTRPGADDVSEAEELERVVPAVERLAGTCEAGISVDTSRPAVMRAAIEAGAGMVNDVRALTQPGALEAVAASSVALCLMHMQGSPQSMQVEPEYGDVVGEVRTYLAERVAVAVAAGIDPGRLVLDPGFGFGKSLKHNLGLLAQLRALAALGCPLLVGISRKRMIGDLTGRPVDERLAGTVAANVLALQQGALILRVHDVAPAVDAVRVWAACNREQVVYES